MTTGLRDQHYLLTKAFNVGHCMDYDLTGVNCDEKADTRASIAATGTTMFTLQGLDVRVHAQAYQQLRQH